MTEPERYRITHSHTGAKLCEKCAPWSDEVNHPPGMIFVGWGHGWVPCSRCGGSGLAVTTTIEVETREVLVRSKFTTADGDQIELRRLGDKQVVLDLKTRPTATMNVDELEVLRDECDRFAKAIRTDLGLDATKEEV